MVPGGAAGCVVNPTTIGPSPPAASPPMFRQMNASASVAAAVYGPQSSYAGGASADPKARQQHHHHQYANHGHDRHYGDHQFNVINAACLPPTPPDDNFDGGSGGSSSSSPSAAVMPYHHHHQQHVFSPTQTHDCYGVPAHPSVDDFPSPPHQQLQQLHPYPYVSQLQPPMSLLRQNNNNNNNNNINNNYYSPPPPPPPPPSSSYEHGDFLPGKHAAGYNSSRQMRNLAEKQRRNKLNTCINELSQLVPLISNSSKKIEKTSVLRLSAAYLRLSRLLMGLKEQREELPVYVNKVNLADLMLDDRDIYLMVTSSGKIVFVSHSVENILGYPQIDLMGQSLFNITCPEDHEELKLNLKYQDDESSSSNTIDDPTLNSKLVGYSGFKVQRRSFYLRLVKKVVSRGEQPDLELVHVVGTLMAQNSNLKGSLLGGNDIVLNAVVRPYNERRVTEVSMLEATREEYITRHHIDSRIIYVDHRISIVSGFMPQEVSGQLALSYMHKDDVRWVAIALRQMYFKGQSFGKSCYRLLSKNGEFVYMRTLGYLELNEDSIQSFMCVNTLVSAEEGKEEIKNMRKRFTPIIQSQPEPGIAAITNNQFMEADSTTSLIHACTEDPKTINKVVEQMIINIPAPAIDKVIETAQNPGPLPDSQFIKIKLLSESMPPVKPSSNAPKIDKRSSTSPRPIKPLIQDRPSVLRVAPHPVVVYNQQTNEKSAEKDRKYYERRGGILVVPKRHNELPLIPEHSPKKAKIISETQVDSPTCSQYSNQQDSLQSDNHLSTDGYGSLDDFSSFQDTPIHFTNDQDIDLDALADVNMASLDTFSKPLDNNETLTHFLTPEGFNSYNTGIFNEENPTEIIIQDPIMHVLQHDGIVESELLEEKQNSLKTKLDNQVGQLKEIQTELDSLSSNADTHYLTTNFSNLKAAHEKQQKLLLSLKGAHQNIGV